MANILNPDENYNPKIGLKNIYTKLVEMIKVLNGLVSNSGNPKVYKALISQSGTSAPVAIELVNTLGVTPTYSYDITGEFYLNCTGIFSDPSKILILSPPYDGTSGEGVRITVNDINSLFIQTFKSGAAFDGLLSNYSIMIEVYP